MFKKKIFIVACLFVLPLGAFDKSTIIAQFLHKHKTLQAIARRMETLKLRDAPNKKMYVMFAQYVQPLLITTTEINHRLVGEKFQLTEELAEVISKFEHDYQPYEELVNLMDVLLLRVEKIYEFGKKSGELTDES